MVKKILVFLLLFIGCSPHSPKDFQVAGDSICRSLVKDLQKIEKREDFAAISPKLKVQFDQLVELIIEAKIFQFEHPEKASFNYEESPASALLLSELKRVYKIEGGRAVIESCQSESLAKLDAFEKSYARKKLKRK